jgi:SAM-dependent methyltransferase
LLSKFINQHINSDRRFLFIELGCGGGSFLPYLQKRYNNLEIFGIDNSLIGCKLALRRLDSIFPSVNILCGDITQSPLISEKFDIAFSFGLIEHFECPDMVLKNHVDLLKPGGLLICVVPNVIGLQGKFFGSKMWRFKDASPEHFKNRIWGMKRISIEDLETWCNDIGLNDINVSPIGGIFPMLQMESYHPEKKLTSRKLTYYIYRYFLSLLFIAVNIPSLCRLDSLSFSPYLIAVGIKK